MEQNSLSKSLQTESSLSFVKKLLRLLVRWNYGSQTDCLKLIWLSLSCQTVTEKISRMFTQFHLYGFGSDKLLLWLFVLGATCYWDTVYISVTIWTTAHSALPDKSQVLAQLYSGLYATALNTFPHIFVHLPWHPKFHNISYCICTYQSKENTNSSHRKEIKQQSQTAWKQTTRRPMMTFLTEYQPKECQPM